MNNYKKGIIAEYVAAFWLFLKGHKIIKMRLKNKVGEIDILSKKGKIFYISEVKKRQNFEKGIEAINKRQIKRCCAAFFAYAQYKKLEYSEIIAQGIIISPFSLPKCVLIDEISM